jgi:CheY-like chemotaxis protein
LRDQGIFVPEVLLVDDNTAQLNVGEAVLRAVGIPIACASTTFEAFAYLRPVGANADAP